MDSPRAQAGDSPGATLHSNTPSISMSSPAISIFTRGHSSRGSASTSSVASSPHLRDSFDLYGTKLEQVTEEPQEREDLGDNVYENGGYFLDATRGSITAEGPLSIVPRSSTAEYSLGDQDNWSVASSSQQPPKRQRSMERSSSMTHRLSNRFGSLSRRWKHRSAAAAPELSIVTHSFIPASRTSSTSSTHILSPALSAISKHESYLPPSPVRTVVEDTLREAEGTTAPIGVPNTNDAEYEEDAGQATTPLLPPVFTQLARADSPIHSPLQSPSIAPTPTILSGRPSMDMQYSSLPSPPLSAKPSLASVRQRSRTNTTTVTGTSSPLTPHLGDIPSMSMLDELCDPWALKLGHANFHIHPEPYEPEKIDLGAYAEFRQNWDQARTNYTRHLARTIEHYGMTSKVYKLTEEKWTDIDNTWKMIDAQLSTVLAPVLARISDNDTDMPDSLGSSSVLEKPVTRVIIPVIDDTSGKFPEMGDGEIVGPMSVARPRAEELQQRSIPGNLSPPGSPRKRNLFKYLSDIFGRHHDRLVHN